MSIFLDKAKDRLKIFLYFVGQDFFLNVSSQPMREGFKVSIQTK